MQKDSKNGWRKVERLLVIVLERFEELQFANLVHISVLLSITYLSNGLYSWNVSFNIIQVSIKNKIRIN